MDGEVAFWIGWDDVSTELAVDHRRGRILADDLSESFVASFQIWSAHDYEGQWRQGLERAVAGQPSALITTLGRGTDGLFRGIRWPLYRVDNSIVIREQLVLPETVPGFDPARLYESITRRGTKPNVSEWVVPVEALLDFLG